MFENKKIFILGMAKSGYEAAKLLKKHNCEILITDLKEQDEKQVLELKEMGIDLIVTDKPEDLLDETYDYVVKNPGIKIEHPVCIKAEKLNIPVTNEVEVAYSFFKNVKIIGITGSNGKTTTTTLIYNFLKSSGLSVYLGGNIGYPVCSLCELLKPNDILVLELSAQQLYSTINFKTDISVLTNLSEVHLDYFKTYENYIKSKKRIFNFHNENNIAIYNLNDINVCKCVKNIKDKKISFSSSIDADLYLKNDAIYYKNDLIIKTDDILIHGNHNYENIMCAIAVAKEYNVSNDVIHDILTKFNGVEHRMEYVKTINGREFYNDSKSTNVKSTQTALKSFSKNTILLLGGLDRGHSFDDLIDYMNNVSCVISFGQTKNRIKEFCDKNNIKCIVVDNLKEALPKAYDVSTNNSVILLSPACASWDQYGHFEERGEEFKKLVNNLN